MELANDVLGRLVSESKLAADVHAAMTIPARPRTHQEFLAPFAKGDVMPLVVEELVIGETPNPVMLRWQQTRDAATFAADMTGFFVAAFGPSLFGGNEPLRDLFASRIEATIARTPDDIARPLVTATLRIARR